MTLLAALALAGPGPAQGQTSSRNAPLPESSVLERLQSSQRTDGGIPLGATVDPTQYYVGPSDVLAVNLWTSPPVQHRLEVTPEGTLIVPAVGEIRVSGLLLSEAKEKVLEAVRMRYLAVKASVTLVRPRAVIVSIRGEVLHEGEYTLYATDRTDQVITQANKPAPSDPDYRPAQVLQQMSLRRLIITHRDGSRSLVDLVKFISTGNDSLNPYLREGDVIVVPRKDFTRNVIGIYGEVNLPGRYEFVEGDRISDAIRIGQGLTGDAVADSVEFSRLSDDGRVMQESMIDVGALVPGSPGDFPLAPGDRIIVRRRSELRADYRVRVEGEVLFPGTYPITRDRTKISHIIRQAGGFTEFAALGTAELSRRSVRPGEVEIDRLMSLRAGVSQEDSLDYIRETDLRLRKEIVNVDFARLFLEGDSLQDVVLQDEDVIQIPSLKRTIYVFGQIVSPGHVPYMKGEDPEYYVRKAGGYTDRARRDDVRVVKSKTKQLLAARETELEEGDYLWVPKEPDRPFASYMNTAAQAATVLSVIVGMAAVIVSVSK